MTIDWWTLGLQTVNLLVLLWLLGRFLFRPLAAIVAERRAAAAKLLDEAQAERTAAQQAKAQIETERKAIADERAARLDAVAQEAESRRAAILKDAQAQVDRMREEAKASAQQAHKDEERRIGHRAQMLAGDIAARLLERLPEMPATDSFLPGFEQALAGLPASTRAALGEEGEQPVLLSAQPLDDAGKAACLAAIERATGHRLAPDFRTDPALIAGLRLETPHAVVANSFRTDIDRILAGFERQDREGAA
ncbi:MAG: ATPase [Sphingobium sp.]